MDNFERIRGVIAEALYVDKEDVEHDTNLVRDLGAESIDFLDIVFRLEKEFDIKIPRGEIERRTRGDLADEQFAVDGRLTEAALARLRQVMPEVPPGEIVPGLMVRDIPRLMTAATFERMVSELLAEQGVAVLAPERRMPPLAPAAGEEGARPDPSTRAFPATPPP